MINIVHFIECLPCYGGTPQKLLYLTKYSDKDVRNIFLCYQPSEMKSQFIENNAIVNEINSLSFIDLVSFFNKGIKEHKPDIICTHFTRPLLAGYIAAKILNNIPIIHNEHSSAYYRKGMGLHLSKLILPKVNAIICNSAHTLASINSVYSLIKPEKSTVIYNPVEKRVQNKNRENIRSQLGLSDHDVLIGHVGGMIENRDQRTLIEAFNKIRYQNPNKKLLLIGDGPLALDLKSLVSSLKLDDLVIFIGYTNQIGDYLSAMDIYVNPTIDEGFGIAVVEAMLAKLPVVLANCGAHPELIEHELSGLLYPGGNSVALAESLQRLINDKEFVIELSNNGLARAEKLFAPERYTKAYIEEVKSVINH